MQYNNKDNNNNLKPQTMENLVEILEDVFVNSGWSNEEIFGLTTEDILDNFEISVTEEELNEALYRAANNCHIIY